MKPVSEQVVLGLGEVLWDCFDSSRRPGGAPANVSFNARQLGHLGLICSRVGTDPLGEELLEYLASRKLETQYIQRDSVNPTGRVTVDAAAQAGNPAQSVTDRDRRRRGRARCPGGLADAGQGRRVDGPVRRPST